MAIVIAIFTAIAELMKALVLVIPDLLKLLHLIVQWFVDRKQREIDAEQAQVNSQLKSQTEEAVKGAANLKAFKLLLIESWQTRYEQVLAEITAGRLENVLFLTESIDVPAVDEILFHSELPAEQKAMKIVLIMQDKEKP